MTDPTKVLVLDDDPDVAKGWVEQIRERFSAKDRYRVSAPNDQSAIENSVHEIIMRQLSARDGKDRKREYTLFDDHDVLIVDYDLVHIDDSTGRYTGEGIGRIVRCFSDCSLIIVMNQFAETDFDLTQRGNISSHADLNINSTLITNPALWGACDDGVSFCPWHWAPIDYELKRVRACAIELSEAGRDASILELLGFDLELASRLSDEALGFLAPAAESIEQALATTSTTFLAENSAAAERKDADAMLKSEESQWAKVVASRVTKWLDRSVANRRDLVIDLPHLVERYPFLMPETKRQSLEDWNKLSTPEAAEWFKDSIPEQVWFKRHSWLLRPSVWLPRLQANDAFQKQLSTYDFSDAPDFVFQEDASQFAPSDKSKPFKAQLNSPFERRFLQHFTEIKYAPRRRFSL
ncbi:hypothetical protein [Maricaulis maris]|uniref:hypothetical protein n=1 Tax=Maricaulis maris TaxID=74318 RepID=UPI003A8EFB61